MPRGLATCVLALLGFSCGTAQAAPPVESAAGRRAIRGAPVDVAEEPEALRALREFEAEAFPRPGLYVPVEDEAPPPRTASLTGGLGPDALPPELRSPERLRDPAPAAEAAIPWLSGLVMPDLPVRLDPRVVRYLEFYKDDRRGRAIMTSWLKAQGRYRALIEEALRKAGLPRALLYVCMIESGYDPHDRSHAGAVGLWQLMPAAGRIYGLRIDYWVDERRDPEKATAATMRYIGDLYARFGSWHLVLAAFNAGYGGVMRSMRHFNTNDYWELARHENGLPWETTLYVPKALAAAIVGENRGRFGYDEVAADPPFAFDKVQVPAGTGLPQVARAAGVTLGEVEALNPELRRKRTPPDATRWEVRVPKGAGARFATGFAEHREAVQPFVVRFGERLDDLARAFGITPRELRQMNGIEDSSDVRPGLTLVVPAGRKPLPPPACETTVVAVPDKDQVVAGRKRVFYRTLPGDTVPDVAAFFHVKTTELIRYNALDAEAKLAGNMVLQLWVPKDFDESKAALLDPAIVRLVTTGSDEFYDVVEAQKGRVRLSYSVKPGDDLKKIGRKFGLTAADLERINRFHPSGPLKVGQPLVVYRAMTAAEKAKQSCLPAGGADRTAAPPPEDDPALSDDSDALERALGRDDAGRALPRPPPPELDDHKAPAPRP